MKVTVCELPNQSGALSEAWEQLAEHVTIEKSELVLLPEMPFYRWLAHTDQANPQEWEAAVAAHQQWIAQLGDLAPALVISTRPDIIKNKHQNVGYIWQKESGVQDVHKKYYLPNEPAFWEATWYERGDGSFEVTKTEKGNIGFLICTELWFTQHARAYSKAGIHFLVCPRATPNPTATKWVAGGQATAVISGAFCLSSNLAGKTAAGSDFAGVGWIIDPEEGKVLGLTSAERPFLTLDIDLDRANQAKQSYPRYVLD